MRPIIEFCQSNLGAGTESVRRELEKDPNLDVIEYDCLSHCTVCARYPYALVEGVVVTGETTKQLLENIYKQLEKNEIMY